MRELEETHDTDSIKKLICKFLSLQKIHDDPERLDIAIEFYYYCYCFCGKMAFSSRKTAAFLSIIHDAFMRDAAGIYPNWTMIKSCEKLHNVILKHSVQRPPHRLYSNYVSYVCIILLFGLLIV